VSDRALVAEGGPVLRRSLVLGALVTGSRVFSFLALVLAARRFPAAEFGAVNLAQQIAAIALMASAAGLDLYAVKRGVERASDLGALASTVLLWRLALGLVAFAGVLALGFAVPQWRGALPVVLCFALTVFSGAISVAWVAQVVRRTDVFGVAQLAGQVLYLAFVALALALELPVWSVGAALVLGEGLTALGLVAWMSARVAPLARPFEWPRARGLLGESLPIGAGQIVRAAALGSDVVLLGLLASLEDTGRYGGAYRFYLFTLSLLAVYFVVLFPDLVERGNEGRAALGRELRRSLARTAVPFALGLALVAACAPRLLSLLFGAGYETAGGSLRILLLASFVALLNGHARQALVASGRQQADLRNVVVSTLAHVLAKSLLIPRFGIEGAALGTLLGEGVLLLSSWTSLGILARRG
jgi:O-antigen/teichoic acid export membrane protein